MLARKVCDALLAVLAVALTLIVFVAFGAREAWAAEGTIAVVGCSYTGEEAEGYRRVSEEDNLADVTREELSGFTLSDWANGSSDAWNVFKNHEPVGGYEGAWVELCLDGSEEDGFYVEQVKSVLERLKTGYGLYPREVYVSGESPYESAKLCKERNAGVSSRIADLVSATEGVRRGPDVGPISSSELEDDGCHLSPVGEERAGGQLVGYFDGGGPPPAVSPTLGVNLLAMLLSGTEPTVIFTAVVGGTMPGAINYTFYCDNRLPGTAVAVGWDAQYVGETAEAAAALCTYPGRGGPYVAKVIVERGTLSAEDRLVFDLR